MVSVFLHVRHLVDMDSDDNDVLRSQQTAPEPVP